MTRRTPGVRTVDTLNVRMISLTRICKQYGRQILFVDASFQLNPGEAVGLVGPNGSGKTTLFRLIVGEEVPHAHLHVVPINHPGELSFAHVDASPDPAALDDAATRIRARLRALGATDVSD